MYKELVKRKIDLGLRRPFRPETGRKLKRLNEMDYIYGNLTLDGTELSRGQVEGMMEGTIPGDASLRECVFVKNCMNTLELMRDCLALKNSLDKKLLIKFYGVLTGKKAEFRNTEPVIADFDYAPPSHTEIETSLNKLLQEAYKIGANEIRRAAALHCGIIRICPFEEYNETMARLAMNYYLEEKGFQPVALGYNRSEYIKTMIECLKDQDDTIFFWGLERAEFNKLDQVLQIVETDESELVKNEEAEFVKKNEK